MIIPKINIPKGFKLPIIIGILSVVWVIMVRNGFCGNDWGSLTCVLPFMPLVLLKASINSFMFLVGAFAEGFIVTWIVVKYLGK